MKKYVEINLKDFNITLPIAQEGNSAIDNKITDSQKETITKEIKALLNEPAEFRKIVKVNKITVLPPNYIKKNELKPGRIVRTNTNEIGIITRIVNRRPHDDTPSVSVVLPGHRNLYFEEHQLTKVDATFEETRCVRFDFSREEDLWHIGDTGYFNYNGIDYKVIVGKTERGYTYIHKVFSEDEETASITWRIPVFTCPLHIKEFLTEEEAARYVSLDTAVSGYRYLLKGIEAYGGNRIRFTNEEKVAFINRIVYEMQPRLQLSNTGKEIIDFHKNVIAQTNPIVLKKYEGIMAELSNQIAAGQ